MDFSKMQQDIERRRNEILRSIETSRNNARTVGFTVAGIFIAVFAFSILCLVIHKLSKLCRPRDNDLVSRSNEHRPTASMQSHEQAIALSFNFPASGSEQQTPSMEHWPQNMLAQSIPCQEQTQQRFPAQRHQIQPYLQQQRSVQWFQHPTTTSEFQQISRAPKIYSQQELPPRYDDIFS